MFKKTVIYFLWIFLLVQNWGKILQGMVLVYEDYAVDGQIDGNFENISHEKRVKKGVETKRVSRHRRHTSSASPEALDWDALHKLCADAGGDNKFSKSCTIFDETRNKYDAKIIGICSGCALKIEIAISGDSGIVYETKSIKISGIKEPNTDVKLLARARLFTQTVLLKPEVRVVIFVVNADAEEKCYQAHVFFDEKNLAQELLSENLAESL